MDLNRFKLIDQANLISDKIWNEISEWSHFEKDTIGKQLARAADSISANLSEAYGRFSFQDRKRFAYYARGSLCETINWCTKAITREMIDEVKGNNLLTELNFLSYGLNAYIKSLAKS